MPGISIYDMKAFSRMPGAYANAITVKHALVRVNIPVSRSQRKCSLAVSLCDLALRPVSWESVCMVETCVRTCVGAHSMDFLRYIVHVCVIRHV